MSNVVPINDAQKEQQKRMLQHKILENLNTLRRFAYSLTQDIHDADDLAQIVVEKMINAREPEHQGFIPWMFRICKHAWIDELRSRKVRQSSEDVNLEELPDNSNSHTLETGAVKEDIIKAIEALPDAQRMVITLVVIGGMSYQECAETLGIPIGSVMSRISRARCKLADRLRTKN